MTTKFVIFDYDGVIVDSLELALKAATEAASAVGVERVVSANDLETLDNVTFDDLGRHIGIPEARIDDFMASLLPFLARHGDLVEVFAGMPELLRGLAEQHQVAIISASERATIRAVLEREGLEDAITVILGSDIPGAKAEKIAGAAKQLDMDQERVWMVGDSISDIRQGKLAGVHTMAVTWGWQSRARLVAEQPDAIFDEPGAIMDFFNSR